MKFLKSRLASSEPAISRQRAEVPASACIPYAVQIDPHTVKTHEGAYLQIVRLEGYAFDTADLDEIETRKRIRNHLWRMTAGATLAVYHHLVRRERPAEPEGDFPPGFAHDLNEAWKRQLSNRKMYTNDIYLTIVRKPGTGVVGQAGDIFAALSYRVDERERHRHDHSALAELRDATRLVMESFKTYQPRLLGTTRSPQGIPLSEPLQMLGFLINLRDRPFAVPERPINEILPVARPVFRHENIDLWHAEKTVHAGMLSIKEYPSSTTSTMFDRLLALPMEFVMSQSFRFEERHTTEVQIDRQRRRLIATGDRGLSQIAALDRAMDENKSDLGFGMHHATITVWEADASELARKIAVVDASMSEIGIACVRENANLEAAFYAQLPGNFRFTTRAARLSTKNFASFASGHNFAQGARQGHWGAAVTVLPTASSTAHYFNFHVADRGNTLVLGPTGQGKTLTLSFLFAQSLKLGGRRVFLDKDRGMEIFVRAVGGDYFRIEAGRRTGWNPLQIADSPLARNFLVDWFEAMLTHHGQEALTIEDRQRIKQVVASVFDLPEHHRVLRHVAPMFGNAEQDRLAQRLLDWYTHPKFGEGQYTWLFDNDTNDLSIDAECIGFDMTQILDMPHARTPAVLWLFFLIEQLTQGQPLGIFADEGWRLLDDELVAQRLEDIEFVIRKKNGLLVFATQTPETVIGSKIAPALKQQSETLILFPNPKAERDVYCGYLDLNETQFDLIKNRLPDLGQPGWFLVRNSRGASVCHLDMRGMDEFIAVLSGNKNTVALLDRLIAEHGREPHAWLPHFYKQYRNARVG